MVKLSPRFKFVIIVVVVVVIVVVVIIIIIIIIIIFLVISSMQGIYNYIPEINYVSWEYTVASVLFCSVQYLQFVPHVKLFLQ